MTVQELIDELSKCPPKSKVWFSNYEGTFEIERVEQNAVNGGETLLFDEDSN